jgi:hypothetical protein
MGVRRKKVINLMVEREINRSAIKLSTYGSMTPGIKRTIKEGFRTLRVKGLAPRDRGYVAAIHRVAEKGHSRKFAAARPLTASLLVIIVSVVANQP